MVVNETITDQELRAFIFQMYPKELLQHALLVTGSAFRSTRNTHLYYLKNYYSNLKQFTPNLLSNIDFRTAHSKDDFQKVLEILTEIQMGKRRKLPEDVPIDFISPSWNKLVFENEKE